MGLGNKTTLLGLGNKLLGQAQEKTVCLCHVGVSSYLYHENNIVVCRHLCACLSAMLGYTHLGGYFTLGANSQTGYYTPSASFFSLSSFQLIWSFKTPTSLPLCVKPLHSEFMLLQSSPVTWSPHLHFHSKEVSESYSPPLPLCIRSYLLCSRYPGERERAAQCTILLTPVSDN